VYEQLEAVMASDSGENLDLRISHLFDSFSALSSDPQDMSIRQNVVSHAVQLTQTFRDIDNSLSHSSDLVLDSAGKSLDRINLLLSDLGSINESIRQGEVRNNPNHMSLDLQVQKLEELSGLIDFEEFRTPTGALEIRIGGILVLDEDGASNLRADVNEVDKVFRLRLDNGKTVQPKGGQLGSEIEMYTKNIPELNARLDQIAETVVREVNQLHNDGFGLEDNASRDFFESDGLRAGTISVSELIRTDIQHIVASSVAGEAGNGTLAARISELRNVKFIGGQNLNELSVDLISTPGSELNHLYSVMEARESEIHMLEVQQEQEAGVNVDEELSLLINYQNAYQGAARVMRVAQEMYDTLLSITR